MRNLDTCKNDQQDGNFGVFFFVGRCVDFLYKKTN